MKLYLSHYRQNDKNTLYQEAADVESLTDLRKAVTRDHIAADMVGKHRKNDNFLSSDCIMLDLDNTHSDDPEDWKTPDDIADAFPDVPFWYIHSRNHMKEKTKTAKDGTITRYEPRPKYHCYFPLSEVYTNRDQYETLMLMAAGLFPFFDLAAAKPAQPFFGVENPTGGEMPGYMPLDEYLRAHVRAADIVDSVKDFMKKYGKHDRETEKAVSRLYSALGVQEEPPAHTEPEAISNNQPQTDGAGYSKSGYSIANVEQQQRFEWLKSWAQKYGVELGRAYRIRSREHPDAVCICVSCPWENEHSMNGAENEAVIIIELGGKIGFLCRHSHGGRYNWKDFRAYYEQRAGQGPQYDINNLTLNDNSWMNDTPKPPAKEDQGAAQAERAAGEMQLPGLLTYSDAVTIFEQADDRYIELKSFPAFSKTAKIKVHDSVVLAADTGAGKSSLALNFLNELNADYPCIYINLEMDTVTALRRLAAIQSGLEIDCIEGYKNDDQTAAAVNAALQAITGRKPLQVIQGAYRVGDATAYTLEGIAAIIARSTAGRTDPTIVIIDHSLLVDTQKNTGSRYDRFTQVSEGLRRLALSYNIILFVLLQQNRAGKASDDERPKNSSLKESGSWENDATQICFLWFDPTDRKKKLLLTKNRSGGTGEFTLNYWAKTQTYTEAAGSEANTGREKVAANRQTKRERQKRKLMNAYEMAYITTFGEPTLQAIAEAADVTTATVKAWIKEYGGFMINGQAVDPAGLDVTIEEQEFVKLTPTDDNPFTVVGKDTGGNGQPVTARF